MQGSASTSTEARRSIRYMAEVALAYGKVDDLEDLLSRVAAFRQYAPFNALLLLLQRPAATYVLPAHKWESRFGHVIRPEQQPLVMLQQGGPVMFLFDVSQTEPGQGARQLPMEIANPYAMTPATNAEDALRWLIANAKADGVRVQDGKLGSRSRAASA